MVRLENRFVGTLDWTTIHEERRTGALAEAATTAAAAAPATAPREYYTASSAPCPFAGPSPRLSPYRHPFPSKRRVLPPSVAPSRFYRRGLLSSPSPPAPHCNRRSLPSPFLLFAPSREWPSLPRAATTPTAPARGVVRATGRGRPRTGTCVTRSLDYTRACKNYYYGRARRERSAPRRAATAARTVGP